LENRGGKDDEMSGRMWETVEANARKIRMGKAEGGRNKGRGRKETRGERKTKG